MCRNEDSGHPRGRGLLTCGRFPGAGEIVFLYREEAGEGVPLTFGKSNIVPVICGLPCLCIILQ